MVRFVNSDRAEKISSLELEESTSRKCIGICKLDDMDTCIGCHRTIEEITMAGKNVSTFEVRKTRHNSLTDFRDWLLKNTKEKVVSFDGGTLVMKRGKKHITYGMIDSEVYEHE